MPALVRQGPFSYDTNAYSATRTYNLVKAAFVADSGDILEVIINGIKIIGEGANVGGDEFTVNSLTNPTSITVVSTFTTTDPATSAALVFSSGTIIVKRLSNRSTPVVDFAPGSVIRETDLDSSTNQTLHVAQEAIDIALNAMVLQANDKFDGRSKVIEDVADGVADNDAVNIGQLETHDTTITGYRDTTLAYREDTEDYKLEAADWAQKVNGAVNPYTDNVAGSGSTSYSAKAHAIGGTGVDVQTGSAKDWATKATTPSSTATDASAKEWATGTSTHKNDGSAKSWAQDADAVDGAGANDRSAKAWSQGASMTGATLGGSSKDWAQTVGATINGSEYSAKEYALGTTVPAGSAKDWAILAEDSVVDGSSGYSALHWAAKAEDARIAAANSAAAVSQVYDNFDDVYLGSMRTDKTVADAVTLSNATWTKDSSSIAFTGIASGTVTIGQELTSTGSGYPVGANIIGSQTTTPIVISNPFTAASPSPQTLVFVGSGVNGAFNSGTGGPATNNDGDALVAGNLYFNSQANEMRIWQGAEWLAATAVGQTSLLEYKFVTTSGQVSSKTYSGTADVGGTLSYTQDNIIVFMNGVQLKNTTDYTATNGSSVVLAVAAALNDEINIIAFKSFTTADMVSKGSGGTFAGAVTFTSRDIHNGGITVANDGQIGSVGDADSIAISSAGVVTMNQIPVFSAGINVSGGTIAGTLSTVAQGNITSLGTLNTLTVDNVIVNGTTIGHTSDTDLLTLTSGNLAVAGDVFPSADNATDLGSAAKRWRNVYTTDLHLANERGNWTVIEEEDYLTLRNNKTDKVYRLVMEEI